MDEGSSDEQWLDVAIIDVKELYTVDQMNRFLDETNVKVGVECLS